MHVCKSYNNYKTNNYVKISFIYRIVTIKIHDIVYVVFGSQHFPDWMRLEIQSFITVQQYVPMVLTSPNLYHSSSHVGLMESLMCTTNMSSSLIQNAQVWGLGMGNCVSHLIQQYINSGVETPYKVQC